MGTMHATAMIVGLLVVAPVEGAPAPSDIRLVLELEKVKYAPFEPVVVDYSLRNLGDHPMSVPSAVDPSFGFIKFEVSDRSGRFQPYHTGLMAHGLQSKRRPTLRRTSTRRSGRTISFR
jgi:hypothetical protein